MRWRLPSDAAGGELFHLVAAVSSEDREVEQPAIELLAELGWTCADLMDEAPEPGSATGRMSFREVFLPGRLRAALERLNPHVPAQALDDAIEQLTRDRSTMLPVRANQEVHRLLREGAPIEVKSEDGSVRPDRVRFINWTDANSNDFFLASQCWVYSDLYKRRPDLVGFVNGIPLLLVELKAVQENVADAYEKNLRDYRDTIPRIFDANGFVILSNGGEALMGPSHSSFEFFASWKRLHEEEEGEAIDLERMLRATCEPVRFLDIIENFNFFHEARGGTYKVLAKYHQVLGVNRAIEAVERIKDNRGRLGVFWHTQGSGKSLSMAFFAEKVLRTRGNNWTFVIVTDRQELDEQIAKTFGAVGALTKGIPQCQAQSRVHLRELLSGNERYVFTLIHKFGLDRGEVMEALSQRSDIIVMTDEAHRSQYDQLAANMRLALPNASFIGFTGTPLIAGQEERTREVFGDYVSIYNFAQSVADGATVPLFYEARKPELQLAKDDLRDELDELLDQAALDDEQEKRLGHEFTRQYHLITRSSRLDEIASDVVRHFAARGYRGKAMFVAIDKATVVSMHDRVQRYWAALIREKEADLAAAPLEARKVLEDQLAWMREADMAVVVSQSQNEIDDLRQKGLDILPHRERMQKEDLETKFKDPDDPLRFVFVCAMWITGFDVPTCSTMYLDKPMKNHTLMQTIARANRRAPGKEAGVIVDYVGVFANLQKALAIYAAPKGGGAPIQDKVVLVEALEEALAEADAFSAELDVDVRGIITVKGFQRVKRIGEAVEAFIGPDERRREYLRRADAVVRAYKAVLPDERASPFLKPVAAYHVVADAIRNRLGPVDISKVSAEIERLLDENIDGVSITVPIRAPEDPEGRVDLSAIDFEKLASLFARQPKTTVDELKSKAQQKARAMASSNPTRVHLVDKLEKLVDAYNAGTLDAERFFEELKNLVGEMDDEERRAAREALTEDELAIFDLLTRPEPKLTKAQEIAVKKVARGLLEKLKVHLGVLQWRNNQRSRATVLSEIRVVLNDLPQEPYPQELWDQKVDAVWQFIRDRYPGSGAEAVRH